MSEDKAALQKYLSYYIARKQTKSILDRGLISQEEFDRADQYLRTHYNIDDAEMYLWRAKEEKEEALKAPTESEKEKKKSEVYVSLTDTAQRYEADNPGYVIQSWLRNNGTVEFLHIWEKENNPNYNLQGYELLKGKMQTAAFTLTAKQWIKETGSIGIISKQGKGGGTLAHPIIACEFMMWLSPEFRLRVIEMRQAISGSL
ncbi:MAG: KilA-N domain-containing protein [Clostridiaceae bacterium]